MADPTKVKPVKAAGGLPSEDELDQMEVLNGLKVQIPPEQVQRLIEAARAKATPAPGPPPPPADVERPAPRPMRRPTARKEASRPPQRPVRRSRRRFQPPRADPPIRKTSGEDWGGVAGLLFVLMVFGLGLPIVLALMGTAMAFKGERLTDWHLWGTIATPFFLGLVFWFLRSGRRRAPPADEDEGYEDDDDDDDDDADHMRYREEFEYERNEVGGRNYGGRAL